MDAYQVLEEWRPGALGAACLVEELEGSGQRFVLKKVECTDEREATLALQEAMTLLKLRHPHICAYKELFMLWDNKISSLFVCLVMDYADQGNLKDIVQQNRDLKRAMDEKVIQRFLGQAVDALVYSHQSNVIHRNLKPSNILLKDERSFLISDFLVETLMTDEMKQHIRVPEGYKLWMAPEALHHRNSTQSDTWSLGCILLDMMTCSTHTDEELAALLQVTRLEPSCLERVLNALHGTCGYSAELCRIPLGMLTMSPEQRPSACDLVSEPYIQKCLLSIGSPLLGLKKGFPPGGAEELTKAGIEKVLDFMQRYPDYEDAQISALRCLSKSISQHDGFRVQEHLALLVEQAMRTHSNALAIQLEGSRLLHNLVSLALAHDQDTECYTASQLIPTLVTAVRRFPHNCELLTMILSVMMQLAASDRTAELLVIAGFLRDTVEIMEQWQEDRELCVSCCGVLWSLSMTECRHGREWLERSVPLVCSLIRKYLSDGQLVEPACCCLWVLCMKGCIEENQVECVSRVLLDSLQTHPQRALLVNNACLALASLLRTSELAAFRVLVPVAGTGGVSGIKEVYQLHSDDPEIAENVCLLFSEMARYEDTRSEMRSQGLVQLLQEIQGKFASSEEIVTFAESVISNLENSVPR